MKDLKDHYKILNLLRNATPEQIWRSFRELARKYHPDVNKEPDAEEKFKEINEAYQILSDPLQRNKYDTELREAERKPKGKLEVSPSVIDFGTLDRGHQTIQTISVDFIGDIKASDDISVAFDFSDKPWFKVTRDLGELSFPLRLQVSVETKNLSPQKHTGWIDINIYGLKSRVTLSINVKEVKPTPPKPLVFTFRSGEVISSPKELVPLCDKYWNEAKEYLYNDRYFKNWFIELRHNDMVDKLEKSTKERNRDIGLEKFLRSIKPDLAKPTIEMQAYNTRLENYDHQAWDSPLPKIEINNHGRGCCYGSVEIDWSWLSTSHKDFAIAPGESYTLEFHPNSYELVWETSHTAKVEIVTNSHNIPKQSFEVFITTAKYPLLSEIETLREQGKWRLALEKLGEIESRHANAEILKKSIQDTKNTIMTNLLIGTALVYGFVGGLIGAGNDPSGAGFIGGGFAGVIFGPLASFIYFEKWGGKTGKEGDYLLGGLAAAIAAGAVYGICIIIIILAILGYLAGGG